MLLFCTAGAWGDGEGRLLEDFEVDGNFWDHEQRIVALETTPLQPNEIVNITSTGGQITIHMADATTFGPFTLPIAILPRRGAWVAGTNYSALDIVSVPTQGIFMVLQPHVGVAPFDPARTIGGNPVYRLDVDPGPVGATGVAGADGADGADGAPGAAGTPGVFTINEQGAFAARAAFDGEAPGFVYISTDGPAGAGAPAVLYIMGSGGAADWLGPFPWAGPAGSAGAAGAAGATGATGAAGANFNVDETGTFAGRATFDLEAAGFSYLSTNGDGTGIPPGSLGSIYIKLSATSADWSARVPFTGPQGDVGATGDAGPPGATGSTGPAGSNADPDAVGLFSGRAAYNAQAQGFIYLSTNGDGATNIDASLYIKNSAANADWSARIPFTGPRGLTGATGPAGAAGGVGPQGPAGNNGVGVAAGGTTGQALVKTSNADFATGWADIATAGYVDAAIAALRNGVAAGLDTLAEIATELGLKATIVYVDGQITALRNGVAAGLDTLSEIATALALKLNIADLPYSVVETLVVALSDETTAITTGTKATIRMPYKGQIVGLPRASLNTTSSSGLPTVDINKNGATMLSTKLSIDVGEKTSVTAAAAAVVSVATFNDDDEITFDIDVAGTGAKGLKVTMYIQKVV